jgi:hypothetical protein
MTILQGLIENAARDSNINIQTQTRPLTHTEINNLQEWILQMTEDMGINSNNSPLDLWIKSVPNGFVIKPNGMDDITLTVVCPDQTRSGIVFAKQQLVPILVSIHKALGLYSKVTRVIPCHVVFIADRSFKRTLPAYGQPIQPHHINGALTTFARQPTNNPWRLLVYRWSDSVKCLIHELVHLNNIHVMPQDTAAELAFASRNQIILALPMMRLAIQETITEVIALYILSVVQKSQGNNRLDMIQQNNDALAALFISKFPGWIDQKGSYLEGTHSYAYVIARAALWTDITTFIIHLENGTISTTRDLLNRISSQQPGLFERVRKIEISQSIPKDLLLSPFS